MKPEDYTWGLGLEHEFHIFHVPSKRKDNITDIILFDSEAGVKRLIDSYNKKKIKLSEWEYNFIKNIPFEPTGRVCNKVQILKRVPSKMPELISWKPFCSVLKKRRKFAIDELIDQKRIFLKLLKKDEVTKELIKKYGDIDQYPFGMTRYLKCGKLNKKNEYEFKKDKKGEDKVRTDYTGSFHVTITLPFTEKTTNEEFIKMHKNFANQLQWVEPLLLIGMFTGDEYAPGSIKDRVRGSYRVMNIGWGNFAGSDVRLFDEGLGRYAKTPTYWRKNFSLEGSEKLNACLKPSPSALKEGGKTSLSTDFRTFGDNKKGERVSGYPMKKPNGIEFRIFDNFNNKNLTSLMLFIYLIMQNSMNYETQGYVYENKIWIKELQNIMKYGYTADISKKYKNLLENKLNITIIEDENENMYNCLVKALFKKNKNGFYFRLLYEYDIYLTLIEKGNLKLDFHYMNINEDAWIYAFLIKLNRNNQVLMRFNQLINLLMIIDKINVEKFYLIFKTIMGEAWKNDIKNILMFMKRSYMINYKNLNYKKNMIKINNEYMQNIDNKFINDYLKSYYTSYISPKQSSTNLLKKILFENE